MPAIRSWVGRPVALASAATLLVGCGSVGASLSAPSSAPPASASSPTPLVMLSPLSINNTTTLVVTLVVNGTPVATFPPGTCRGCRGNDGIPVSELPSLPWSVEARSPSGRLLLAMTVRAGDYFQTAYPDGQGENRGDGARVDLSCGRLDIWAGPPMAGPGPPPSFPPGDCDP